MVLRRCRQLLKDEEKALDAMQEVFIKLILYQDRLKYRYPSSLLYRISTNVCLNLLREQRKRDDCLRKRICLPGSQIITTMRKKWSCGILLTGYLEGEKISTREIAVMHFVDGMTL